MAIPQQPTLSIITVTYRNPKGLEDTFASLRPLMASNSLSWEHIVVDSSPEEHRAVLQGLPSSWPLLYLQQPPKGIYPAMNFGLSRASGRFLWFLNGGDALEAVEALAASIGALEKDASLSVVVSAASLYRDGNFLYRHTARTGLAPLLGINRVCHQALVYRRESFADPIGGYDERFRLAADYEHHLRSYLAGKKSITLSGVLVRYDMSGQSGDYRRIMGEFALAQQLNRPRMPGSQAFLHGLARNLEHFRLAIFHRIKGSPVGPLGRRIWVWGRRVLAGPREK